MHHTAQSNGASKADDGFAAMLASVSPKGGKSKTDSDAASIQSSDDTSAQADNKSADAKSVAGAAAQPAQTADKTKPAPQTGDDDAQTISATPDAQAILQPAPQPVAADPALIPPVALAFVPPPPAAIAANDDGDQDEPVSAIGETDSTKPAAATPSAPALATAAPAQGQNGAAPLATASAAQGQTAQTDIQTDAVTQAAAPAADTQPDDSKIKDSKAADAKSVARKPNTAPAADAQTAQKDIQTSVATGDTRAPDAKTADIKTDASVLDSAALKTAATAEPAAPSGLIAASAVTQNTVPATPATLIQHVQVTTAAEKPNLPALAVEIAAKSQSGAKQFDIRLDPPELGRVEVRLSIDATGKASAHLTADQPQTLDLLQKDSTSLTRALRDAGLNVSQDGLNFSLRQQAQNGQDNGQNGQRQSGGSSSRFTATTAIEASTTTASYRSSADGRLDISV